jgi:hypothetical protein
MWVRGLLFLAMKERARVGLACHAEAGNADP